MLSRSRFPTTSRLAVPLLAALTFAASAAHAQGKPLSDDELGGVWGQALISLTNSQSGGLDFSRLTLDATIAMSANFTNLQLGEYSRGVGTGTRDIDIGALQFGRSDLGDAKRTVTITDPYFEFVYKDAAVGSTATREVVGMRLGFGGIAGDVGLLMNTVSGSLKIDTSAATGVAGSTVDSSTDPNGGVRWNGSCPSCTVLLSQIGGVTAGDASGPSRDFFISVLKQAVNFQTAGGMTAAPATAQAGFWMNWTDRLSALNTTGIVPPNTAKTGP
jgi:hypothetical protein